MNMTQQEWMKKLDKQGVQDLTVVTMQPGIKGEHTHEERTIHVILKGELTVHEKNITSVYHGGDYVEFAAGTRHSVEFGPEGLTMIVGTK